jgi:hypothetical protein
MTETNTLSQPWQPAQILMFRFAFIFFALFIFFNPNSSVPGLNETYNYYILPMHKLIVWLGVHVFRLAKPITYFTAGSGDTTYDWLVLVVIIAATVVSTAIWTAIGKKAANYDRLYYWLIVVLRFYVGDTMVIYGAAKVIKLQFPAPGPGRLIEAYGDSSPFTLAWTFMGYSKAYNYFTGIAELTCGLLLFFRRTTLIGAVIAFTVAANIVAINYCFDVPVKILASALLLMVMVILLKDADRFISFFFLNKTTTAANLTPKRFKKRWKNITLIVAKCILIGYAVILTGIEVIQANKEYGDDVKHPVLYGIFNTKTFVLNKDTLAPLTTDTLRWRRIIINARGGVRVDLMNDSAKIYSFKSDTLKKTITLGNTKDTTRKYVFNYKLSKDSVLQISGIGPAGEVNAVMKRFDEKNFTLIKRGFHLVNEYPFGR